MKRRTMLRTDFSVFMCIVFMLAGCLLVLLISNLAVVIVDPSTVIISGIIRASGLEAGSSGNVEMTGKIYAGGNVDKTPHFVDVRRDGLVFYPGENHLPVAALAQPGNTFEKLLDSIAPKANRDYVVLLVRPGTASLSRKLRGAIIGRGIDVGLEIYEAGQAVNSGRGSREQEKGAARAPSV